jgi:2,4-dienoyl-CoA reductase-like NADH-dependent reductase (Old Yellow Enzyme family)/NADPH-dependent 2,4-dienoyl-CoA reductase/sulfur reductase-like enzyme
MQGFENVFQPLRIGNLVAKNRIEVSPAEPFLATEYGHATDDFILFTAALARGGAGIVTVGDSPVNQEYADENHFVINLAAPYIVHSLVRITDAIHRYGALASIELNLRAGYLPADLSREQIKQIIRDFALSAKRCRQGGFDMVMLHGGSGHVVSTFYNPHLNRRTDEYGADTMENRCRFANELIDAVREEVGHSMAIEWRISADEGNPEIGVGPDEALAFAKVIQSKIDMINISMGSMLSGKIYLGIQPTYMPLAPNAVYAERFKRELDIPVTAVGSFTMELAEKAIATGQADMVAMIRSFIADPDQVIKFRQEKAEQIRPCLRCCICTGDDPHGNPKPLRCSVNPVSGRNVAFDVIPAATEPRKVVIVGGGCAGLEAARRAAQRGHRVVLFEKDGQLGGTLLTASANPIKGDLKRYRDWSIRTVEQDEAIEVHLNTPATREAVVAQEPDALIIAVGGEQVIPPVPGIDKDKVALAVDADLGEVDLGKRILIVGAGLTGTETAVHLAQNGHEVTQIDLLALEDIDDTVEISRIISSMIRMMAAEAGVTVFERTQLSEVTDTGALVKDASGDMREIPCDTVLLSVGVRPRSPQVQDLAGLVEQTFIVGDCNTKAGNITKAVREGFYAALNVG